MLHARLNLIAVLAIVALVSGCEKKASEEIDFGKVTDGVYTNEFFAMNVPIPAGWNVQDQETVQKISQMGSDMVAGDDKNLKAALKASELTTVNLFMASELPLGAPVEFNTNLICLAERVSHAPGIKRGRDYLYHTKKMMQSSAMQVKIDEQFTSETIGEREFDVMTINMAMGSMTVFQKYYSTIDKGYALSFICSYNNDEGKTKLQNMLDTIAFKDP